MFLDVVFGPNLNMKVNIMNPCVMCLNGLICVGLDKLKKERETLQQNTEVV